MGEFREDLYYRRNVLRLSLLTVAQRREDVPPLAMHFLERLAQRYDRRLLALSREALELLVSAPWPGNVGQLHNVFGQAAALSAAEVIAVSLVSQALDAKDPTLTSLDEAWRGFEREYRIRILKSSATALSSLGCSGGTPLNQAHLNGQADVAARCSPSCLHRCDQPGGHG